MSKVTPIPVTSVFNTQAINENNRKFAEALNEGVLWRKNPEGEPNDMKNDLDMNEKRIYNLPEPVLDHEAARFKDLKEAKSEVNSVLDKTLQAQKGAENARDRAETAAASAKNSEIITNKNVDLSLEILESVSKGGFHYFRTKAQAEAFSFQEGEFAQVFEDETNKYRNTIYRYISGQLVFQVDLESVRDDLADASAGNGSEMVAYKLGTLYSVLNGNTAFGPTDPVDRAGYSPMIERKMFSTEDMNIFVDPAIGDDSNDGSLTSPVKTIIEAVQRLPQNIYHKIRVYLLDGEYPPEDRFKLFNYYVTARGTAGLRFVGHIQRLDGENHPVYADTDPDAVKIMGYEHVFSGISGTEEVFVAGMSFHDGWAEAYDAQLTFSDCKFYRGHNPPTGTYKSRHAIGGHRNFLNFVRCSFDNVAAIGNASNNAKWVFEACELTNLVSEGTASTKGVTLSSSLGCEIITRNSPTLLATGPGGKPIVAGEFNDLTGFSNVGYAFIRRATPDRDSTVGISSHDAGPGVARGAGIQIYAMNHPDDPGKFKSYFGPTPSAVYTVSFNGTQQGGAKDCLTIRPSGTVSAHSGLTFGINSENLPIYLNDGQASIYVNSADGEVRLMAKFNGQTKTVKLLTF